MSRMGALALLIGLGMAGAVRAEEPPPVEDVELVKWRKTLGDARQSASAKNGFALVFVTDAGPAGRRMETEVLSRPEICEVLEKMYGCVKGSVEDLQKDDQAKAKLSSAGVTQGPALVFVEPGDGSVLDVTLGELGAKQMSRLLEDVDAGRHQKGLEEKAAKEGGDAALRLQVGRARVRKQDWEGAARDFEAALKAEDKKLRGRALVGLAAVAVAGKQWKDAEKALARADECFVEEEEVQDFDSPLAEAAYLRVWIAWNQDLREDATKQARRLLEKWPMAAWAKRLYDQGMDTGWDWYEGKELPK